MVILTNQFIVYLHKKNISLQINVCDSYNNLGKFDQLILKKIEKCFRSTWWFIQAEYSHLW